MEKERHISLQPRRRRLHVEMGFLERSQELRCRQACQRSLVPYIFDTREQGQDSTHKIQQEICKNNWCEAGNSKGCRPSLLQKRKLQGNESCDKKLRA